MQWLNKVTELLTKKAPDLEFFFALIFKERGIKAAVWQEEESHVRVIDQGLADAKKPLSELSDDELIALTDQAIGIAEKTLPQTVKTTKTIFAVGENWVEGTAIKEPYFTKVKKLCKELSLSPLGFVVKEEAIAHFLKQKEGTPPTVLLVFIGVDTIGVTLVQAGRIQASVTNLKEGKSDSELAASIIKSFSNVEVLPSRMLLYDGQVSLEEAKQEFIAYPWTKDLPFLHFPKIDIMPQDSDTEAVVSGAAKEMGFSLEEAKAEHPQEMQAEEKPEEPFGFVKDQDVAELTLEKETREKATDLLSEEEHEGTEEKISLPRWRMPSISLAQAILAVSSLLSLIPYPKSLPGMKTGVWLPLAVVLVILMGASFAAFYFVPSTTITLVAQMRTLEKDVEILIDTKASTIDTKNKKIPAKEVEIKQEGEKSQNTTGKKEVGDKAKGEVIIYNKTENKKTFPKGTILVGPGNLRFALPEEVVVASTAAFELTPSSVKAKAQALQIGEESNVVAGTNFPFKDFPTSSYFAKNETAFTGGTKRELVAVSREDQDNLAAALTDELKNKAKDQLEQEAQDNRIIEDTIEEKIVSKKFSKNIGDEAETVALELSLILRTLTYKESDLFVLVESEIEKDVPEGFMFQKDTFETTVKHVGKEKSGVLGATVRYKATLLPQLEVENIRKTIAGKTKPAVEKYLESLPLDRFSISPNIELPVPFDLLPIRSQNIKVEITSNR